MTANYYVATSGNDANPGMAELPFASVTRGLSATMPGDKVIVRAGLYRGRFQFPRSGRLGQPITLEGEHGAILDGGDRFSRSEMGFTHGS